MQTTYDNLPQQVDHLLAEMLVIKKILLDKIEKTEEVPKPLLSSKVALSKLTAMGYLLVGQSSPKWLRQGKFHAKNWITDYFLVEKNFKLGSTTN